MFRVAAILALCAFAGCAQLQVEHQSDSFNRASATSISEQALLNAVRSSLDLPLSFTKLQKFTAGSMASASVAPKAPNRPMTPHSVPTASRAASARAAIDSSPRTGRDLP